MILQKIKRRVRSVADAARAKILLQAWRQPGLVRAGEVNLYLDPQDGMSAALRRLGVWEREVQEWISSRAGHYECIWEFGACMGFFSYLLAHHNPTARVFGFEPFPRYYALLQRTWQANCNRYPNIVFTQAAVGLHSDSVTFSHDASPYRAVEDINCAHYGQRTFAAAQHTTLPETATPDIEVPVMTLEQIANQTSSVPDLIFMDIEGGEQGVIRSLQRMEWRPDVLMEVHPSFYREWKLDDYLGFCHDLGYDIYWPDGYHVFLASCS